MIRPLQKLLLLLLWALPALACGLNDGPDPVIITATPMGGGTTVDLQPPPDGGGNPLVITATPAPTATFAPVATATLPPSEGLQEGLRSLHNGDYVSAVDFLQAVLNDQTSDSEVRAAAGYALGQAAVREGLYNEALNALDSFLQIFPDHEHAPLAYFLRGDAHSGLANWEQAISDYRQYLTLRPGIADSYALERIGDAHLNLGQSSQAQEAYRQAADANRTLAEEFALREKIAATYVNAGMLGQAIAQYDAILAEAQNAGYRASMEYQAASLEIANGQSEAGYARLQALSQQYPSTRAAYLAMLDLLNAGYSLDPWLQGQIAFNAEDYGAAVEALNRYSAENEVIAPESLLMLGRAYRGIGNYPAAYTTFETVKMQFPDDASYGIAFLEQGRTLYQEGNYESAIQHYVNLAETAPQLPEAPIALYRAGFIYSELGNASAAIETLERLANSYPGHPEALDGLLLAATVAQNNGMTPRAQALYTQLANTGTGSTRAQAFLWLGRFYQAQGQNDLAVQSYTGAAQNSSGDYYAIRAEDLLAGRAPFDPPANYQFEFNDQQDQAAAEQWLRERFGVEGTAPLSPLSDSLQQDARLIRGSELWELGLFEDAKTEFEELRSAYSGDPIALYQLAIYFRDIGLYRSSIMAAAQLLELSGASNFEAPAFLVRLRYPIYYQDLVLPEAEKNGVDPLLVFALIRQESLYESFATSFAAAQGLMQIIPSTGWEIQGRLGWPEDYQNSDVYRPYINVPFGVFYLDWTMDFAGGQPYAALAGYNGGPGNALSWYQISGPDLDAFIQTVSFDESRLYVERIYEQYAVYRYLYGAE